MVRVFKILMLTLLASYNLYGQTDTIAVTVDHYKTNKFEVAIFPANYIDLIPGERFTPTRQEIDQAELMLANNLKALNKDLNHQSSTPVIHKNLPKYKRQYFGYIDQNGNRILYINCFWGKDDSYISDQWLKQRIEVLDGGSYYWNVKFNIDDNELFELYVNGQA